MSVPPVMHAEGADSGPTAIGLGAAGATITDPTAELDALGPPSSGADATEPASTESDTILPDSEDEAAIHHDEFNDNDSAISANFISDTTSLKSYITAYRMENGRRYHAYKDGSYFMPNDDLQNEQLDIGHHLHTMIMDGKLFLAPIGQHPQNVLDLGTGTGIWAIDFADQFPSASVIGTDLSPIQPQWVPPNVRFQIEDYNDDWTFKPEEFDYIHMRNLYGSVNDWPRFYKQAFDRLEPGGWIEQYEISIKFQSDDGTIKPGSALWGFNEMATLLSEKIGRSGTISEDMKGYIDATGFVNTVEIVWKAPHGSWPADPRMKEIGNWGLLELNVGLEGFCMALLTRVLGWSYEEVQVRLARIHEELRSRSIHSYHYIRAVYGQKPYNVQLV